MPRASWHHDGRSSSERGYGAAWRRLRLIILERDGYRCRCDDCKRTGLIRAATHVDHIVSKADWMRKHGSLDGCDHPSNLRAMHRECHERKSAAERGHVYRDGAGLDGMPVGERHHWNRPGGGGKT